MHSQVVPETHNFKESATMKNLFIVIVGMFVNVGLLQAQSDIVAGKIIEKDLVVVNQKLKIQTVLIPAGTFTMGSPESEENRSILEVQHEVTLSAFRMSKYEITNAQYAAFLNAKGIGRDGICANGRYPGKVLIYESFGEYDWGLHYSNSRWVPVASYKRAPVTYVTWYGAAEFAAYMGGALPTEAQWEYACRAGTTTPFSTGTCLTNLQANYYWRVPYGTCKNTVTVYPGKPKSVGRYAANDYGLYDMHGNVWEWCADWYSSYLSSAQTNPTGESWGGSRVLRGGAWHVQAEYCRSAYRNGSDPNSCGHTVGFRVVFLP